MIMENMCRICLRDDVSMESIVDSPLIDLNQSLTSKPFLTNDDRPHEVCQICRQWLESCQRLLRRCIRSEELFDWMAQITGMVPGLSAELSNVTKTASNEMEQTERGLVDDENNNIDSDADDEATDDAMESEGEESSIEEESDISKITDDEATDDAIVPGEEEEYSASDDELFVSNEEEVSRDMTTGSNVPDILKEPSVKLYLEYIKNRNRQIYNEFCVNKPTTDITLSGVKKRKVKRSRHLVNRQRNGDHVSTRSLPVSLRLT